MVEYPLISHESDGTHVVWNAQRKRPFEVVRFLGWLLIIVAAGVILYDVRRWSWAEPSAMLFPLFTGVIGTLLLSVARKQEVLNEPLLRFRARTDEHPPSVQSYTGGAFQDVGLDELTHVVFGLIDYPWPGRKGVVVEAFALYLAREDGTSVPVIDGTLDKVNSWRIGKALSAALELPLIELGKGQE